jgi:hypothetical protein
MGSEATIDTRLPSQDGSHGVSSHNTAPWSWVHVSAEQLAGNVPAATPDRDEEDAAAGSAPEDAGNVPGNAADRCGVSHRRGRFC